ncbi:MAG: ADP-ribosylation factor-like protein, partial [Promethearchaeota archaeon]
TLKKDFFEKQLIKLKEDFYDFFKGDNENLSTKLVIKEAFDPFIDAFHRNLKPKISLIGYSGVGKTTISQLIKADEIPMQHIATINGEISTIKIGNLNFLLWDFAGQEQFGLLWNSFIKGSDAVLIITDSTVENVDKSKNFIELAKKGAPHAHLAIIGNKQDRDGAITTKEIERLTGIKSYSMVAIDPNNRLKMMQIIADLLEMNAEISPLLRPLVERDRLVNKAEEALIEGDLVKSVDLFIKISDLCLELGDDSLSREFLEKSIIINNFLNKN